MTGSDQRAEQLRRRQGPPRRHGGLLPSEAGPHPTVTSLQTVRAICFQKRNPPLPVTLRMTPKTILRVRSTRLPVVEAQVKKTVSRLVEFDSATPWTVPHQAPLSMGFSRQESWSGLPFPPPGDLPNPGIKPGSPALQPDSLPSEPPGKTVETQICKTKLLPAGC